MSVGTLLSYLAIVAGIAAIIKVFTSGRGKVSIPGINIQWGK